MIGAIFGGLALLSSVLLILIVLVQNSKGGGLSSAFGASNISSMVGARHSAEKIEKATWALAAAVMICAFVANTNFSDNSESAGKSRMSNQIENQSFDASQNTSVPAPVSQPAPEK